MNPSAVSTSEISISRTQSGRTVVSTSSPRISALLLQIAAVSVLFRGLQTALVRRLHADLAVARSCVAAVLDEQHGDEDRDHQEEAVRGPDTFSGGAEPVEDGVGAVRGGGAGGGGGRREVAASQVRAEKIYGAA